MTESSDEDIEQLDRDLEPLLSEAVPVHARVAKDIGLHYSLRMSTQEMSEFDEAASARGMRLDDFMIAAARAAMYNDVDLDRAWLIGNVRDKAYELTVAIDRLVHKLPPPTG